jgi:hypothetical protein
MPRHTQPEDPFVAALHAFHELLEPPNFTLLLPHLADMEDETLGPLPGIPVVTLTIASNFL